MWQKLARKWRALQWAQRFILLEAAFTLLVALAAVRLLPFRWIAPRLGRQAVPDNQVPLSPERAQEAQSVGWAVQALSRYLPWDPRCLAQAIAAKWMLQRRGLTSTLYLGVDHGKEQWLEAHAWLSCGNEILTGEPQHERFIIIAAFTEDAT